MSGPSAPAEFFARSPVAVKYRWHPPDGVSTTYVPPGYRCRCCLARIDSMSAPDSGNRVPSSCVAMPARGMSRSTTTSPDGPQEIPMLYGARAHQSRICAGEVVARSCQLPRNAGRFPSVTQGNTCQPSLAAASADRSRAGSRSARVASATLTFTVFLENVIVNRERRRNPRITGKTMVSRRDGRAPGRAARPARPAPAPTAARAARPARRRAPRRAAAAVPAPRR